MICPKCKDAHLEELKLPRSDVLVDRCTRCAGLWFDGGELEEVLNAPGRGISVPPQAKATDLRCPRCNGGLYCFHYHDTDVSIDVCENCAGVWLDDGELPQIKSWHESLTQQEFEKLDVQEFSSGEFIRQFLTDIETAMMPCPHCNEPALQEIRLDYSGIALDRCVKCGGIWFDVGELEQILDVAEEGMQVPGGARKSKRLCPRCAKRLSSFTYPNTEIAVDMCGKCHGLWLDHGEFKAIRQMREIIQLIGQGPDGAASAEKANPFHKLISRITSLFGS